MIPSNLFDFVIACGSNLEIVSSFRDFLSPLVGNSPVRLENSPTLSSNASLITESGSNLL
jgi:hypothetical protein